jgi:hypothetical protein
MATKQVWLTLATLALGAWAVAANAQSTLHLYIHDTHTGSGDAGNDAVWSPNGQYIAYHHWEDFFASGWDPNVPRRSSTSTPSVASRAMAATRPTRRTASSSSISATSATSECPAR